MGCPCHYPGFCIAGCEKEALTGCFGRKTGQAQPTTRVAGSNGPERDRSKPCPGPAAVADMREHDRK
eukprot:14752147-Alexandrium_andersonii.AAC.1